MRPFISYGTHDLFAQRFFVVEQIDTIPFRFSHFPATVESRDFYGFFSEIVTGWFGEIFHTVQSIESACESAGYFEVLFLVFPDRHFRRFVYDDVGGHESRVGKQSRIDVFGLFADFVFERGGTFQFADVGVHIEQKIQFRDFGNVALYEEGTSLRVETCRQIFGQYAFYVHRQHLGVGVGREGMQVGDKEVTVVFMLHFDEIAQGAVVVAQVEVSGRSDSANNDFSHIQFLFLSVCYIIGQNRERLLVCPSAYPEDHLYFVTKVVKFQILSSSAGNTFHIFYV